VNASPNQDVPVDQKDNFQEARCTISASRVICNGKHSLRSRFTTSIGTNPEKLVAAALCSCFSKALIKALEISGFYAERIETTATSILEELPDGLNVTRMQLEVHAKVPGATQDHFIDAAKAAAENPIARLLNATISMSASLDP
jgi:lipoyl-dependent peroxiredoxin